MFGDSGPEGGFPMDESAEALTADTIICSFHMADFKKILYENIMIALNYTRTVNNKLTKLEGRR